MSKKKEKPICLSKLEPEEKLKYEIAEELGISRSYISRIEKGERWRKQKSSDQSVNNFEPDLKREGRFVIIVKLGRNNR